MTESSFNKLQLYLIASITLLLSGCGPSPGTGPVPPPTVGAVGVSIGYGSGGTSTVKCSTDGKYTVTLDGYPPRTIFFAEVGFPTDPACRGSTVFENISPGPNRVVLGDTACPITVIAGQMANVYFRIDGSSVRCSPPFSN